MCFPETYATMSIGATKLVQSLEAQNVEYLFGVCGDTSVGFYHILSKYDGDIRHLLLRDERTAAFAADAYARISGKPGVCEGPSGGGATYLLPGLAEAGDSSVPVVGLNTTIPVRYRGQGVLTELDQKKLFNPVTKWNDSVDHSDQVPRKVREAFRHATAGRPGATHLSFPMEVLDEPSEGEVYAEDRATHVPADRTPPGEEDISAAVSVLEESERPLIVAGGGIHTSKAWKELRSFAEQAGIPVAQTLTSIGCIGDSPYSVGVVGENGYREYADEMIDNSDVLFLFGTAVESVWTEKWTNPPDRTKRIVHVDISPESIGKNYYTEVSIAADLKRTIEKLDDAYDGPRKWDEETIQERQEEWLAPYAAEFDSDEYPVRPERMVAGANEVLDDDAIIVSDPGTSCPYFAALYEFNSPGRHWITPRAHGALGYALPGIIGAYFAKPNSQIVGFTGDGSLGTGYGDLESLVRYDVDATLVVVNNSAFSWIEAGQRNYQEFSFGVDFEPMNYAAIAEEFGLAGYRVEDAAEYEQVLAEAVSTEGPALVDLPTRPLPTIDNVPVDWLEPDE